MYSWQTVELFLAERHIQPRKAVATLRRLAEICDNSGTFPGSQLVWVFWSPALAREFRASHRPMPGMPVPRHREGNVIYIS